MKLFNDDCLNVLKTLPENSIDSLVADPPAGINFMGKDWDGNKGGRDQWINWMTEIMRETYRVLKPGAHGLVWALPRTSHWTATALENAGFEIRDVVTHLFGSGFPKSMNISNAIDKAAGVEGPIIGKNPAYRERQLEHDAKWKTAVRPEHKRGPVTDASRKWDGFGTALKPASEHWILIRKPISEKTVAANVLKWGTGGINIDGCRIETSSPPKTCTNNNIKSNNFAGDNSDRPRDTIYTPNTQGRFPANLVFSHTPYCTDDQCDIECAIKMLDEQSGPCKTGELTGQPRVENKTYGSAGSTLGSPQFYTPDAATGASRFFYCAKISTRERNEGLANFPNIEITHKGAEKRITVGGGKEATPIVKNGHPTVKSQKLMGYLIRLVTPPNGIVLDPFMGSGSTGCAAIKEGFDFVGIEKEKEYFEIAEARINFAKSNLQKEK